MAISEPTSKPLVLPLHFAQTRRSEAHAVGLKPPALPREGRRRGLDAPAEAGFATGSPRLQPPGGRKNYNCSIKDYLKSRLTRLARDHPRGCSGAPARRHREYASTSSARGSTLPREPTQAPTCAGINSAGARTTPQGRWLPHFIPLLRQLLKEQRDSVHGCGFSADSFT
jgi:hypothetical protein